MAEFMTSLERWGSGFRARVGIMTEQDAAALQAAYGKIVAKSWTDEAFKRRLLSDAAAALKEEGVDVPPGVTVKVVENTGETVHLVLPRRPPEGELSDAELEKVAGGQISGEPFHGLPMSDLIGGPLNAVIARLKPDGAD